MKKLWSVLLILMMFCGLMAGCGEKEEFELGKPYVVKNPEGECEVTVTGAERTNVLESFSATEAEEKEIVYLKIDIEVKSNTSSLGFSSMYVWNHVRVCDEKGIEIKPFDYALPGDDTSVVLIDEGKKESCTIPYAVEKGARYLTVDMYQDTEYSNKIKVNID